MTAALSVVAGTTAATGALSLVIPLGMLIVVGVCALLLRRRMR
jgi:hypothetical protein